MKIATTTGDFSFYCDTYEARIRELHRAGFRNIDLGMEFSPDSVYMGDNWRKETEKLKALAEELEMQFVQAHSQCGNPLSDDPAHIDFLLRATQRSMEICQVLGIPNTVVHCGVKPGIGREEYFAGNKAFYEKLFPTMERCGVNALCENGCQSNSRNKCYIYTGRDMRDYIEYVDHPLVHGCWDTGHANCEGSQYDQIMTVGDELYAIHYNDNHGELDDHLAPYFGSLNHDEVISALIDVGFKGYFTLECVFPLIKYNGWPTKRRIFEREGVPTRLRQPQLFMQRHVEALVYDTAKWMLEQYGIFEE